MLFWFPLKTQIAFLDSIFSIQKHDLLFWYVFISAWAVKTPKILANTNVTRYKYCLHYQCRLHQYMFPKCWCQSVQTQGQTRWNVLLAVIVVSVTQEKGHRVIWTVIGQYNADERVHVRAVREATGLRSFNFLKPTCCHLPYVCARGKIRMWQCEILA